MTQPSDLVRCGVTYIEFGLNNEHIIDLMFNYPIKKTDFPELLAAARQGLWDAVTKSRSICIRATKNQCDLTVFSMHAYVHGLLTIMQMNRRIESSATSDFYVASSALQDNLEKMLGSFVKGLDYA